MQTKLRLQGWGGVAFLILALSGGGLLLYGMRWGPWVFSDSVAYILSARNWVEGRGLGIYNPSGEFDPIMPPGYPWLVGAFMALQIDPLVGITAINILCFVLCLFLLGWGTWRLSGSWTWGWTTALWVALAPGVIEGFDGAMSEPPYLALGLLNLYLLVVYSLSPRLEVGVAAALCAAAAGLTRTIGLVNLVVGGVIILGTHWRSPWRGLCNALGYVALAGALPLLWLFRETLPTRPFILSPQLLVQINAFRRGVTPILLQWMPLFRELPASWLKSLALLALVLMAGLGSGWAWWQVRRSKDGLNLCGGLLLWGVMALFALSYGAFLALAYLFSSLPPDLNTRLLMPLGVALAVIIPGGFFLVWRAYRLSPRWEAVLALLCLLPTVSFYLPSTLTYLRERHAGGSGYTGVRWRQSETLQAVQMLPASLPLISNDPIAVLFYTRRFPYEITRLTRVESASFETPFGRGESEEEKVFRERCGALILFEPEFTQQVQAVYGEKAADWIAVFMREALPYRVLGDGAIYFHPACP